METESSAEMRRETGCVPDWRPSRLLAALETLDRPLEEKVGFSLMEDRHLGDAPALRSPAGAEGR